MPRVAIAAAVAAMLAAGAAAGAASREQDTAAALDKALAGRVAGAPTHCVDRSRLGGPQIIGQTDLIYAESGKRLWRNILPERCPFLHPGDTIIVEANGAQICGNDRISTFTQNSAIPSPSCRLGDFTPYDKAADVEAQP